MYGASLTSTALRGLLDVTPAAVGCFDAGLRAVYANTAFTMATGVQAGRALDAGGHEALAALAAEQSALRRVATLVAAGPEPEAVFQAVAEEAGRLLHARSAATVRYEDGFAVTVRRRAVEGVPQQRLAEPLEAAVYFVVAESLTNAVKHADACALHVKMTEADGELRV